MITFGLVFCKNPDVNEDPIIIFLLFCVIPDKVNCPAGHAVQKEAPATRTFVYEEGIKWTEKKAT
jgi:hypothetical protein